jgi:hypothetical protein
MRREIEPSTDAASLYYWIIMRFLQREATDRIEAFHNLFRHDTYDKERFVGFLRSKGLYCGTIFDMNYYDIRDCKSTNIDLGTVINHVAEFYLDFFKGMNQQTWFSYERVCNKKSAGFIYRLYEAFLSSITWLKMNISITPITHISGKEYRICKIKITYNPPNILLIQQMLSENLYPDISKDTWSLFVEVMKQ